MSADETPTSTKLTEQLFSQIYDIVTMVPTEADKAKLPDGAKEGGRYSTSNSAIHISMPGITLYPEDYRDMYTLGNPNGVKSRTAKFSRLVDSIPAVGSSRYTQTPKRVSSAYTAALAGANAQSAPLAPKTKAMLDKTDKFLFHEVVEPPGPFDDPDAPAAEPSRQKTPVYQQYEALQEEIGEAHDELLGISATANSKADWQSGFSDEEIAGMDDSTKQSHADRALKDSENYWSANSGAVIRRYKRLVKQMNGDKNKKYVKQALEFQSTHGNELSQQLIARAKELANSGDWTPVGASLPVKLAYPSSTKFADESVKDGWAKITCSTKDYHSKESTLSVKVDVSGGANFGLWRVKAGGGYEREETHKEVQSKDMTAEMEVALVNISRPWMDATIFSSNVKWDAGEDQKAGSVSSGELDTQTDEHFLPYIPMQMIVVRNVKLIADWSKEEEDFISNASNSDVSVGWGPFSVNTSHQHKDSDTEVDRKGAGAGIDIPGIQCLGFVSWVPPFSAPLDGSAASKTGIDPVENAEEIQKEADAAMLEQREGPIVEQTKVSAG